MTRPTDAAAASEPDRVVLSGPARDASTLHRDALAIRRLLDGLDGDEHALRIRLLSARFALRAEAAADWRRRGWRPITDDR